jgi:deoxyribonuclease-4
VFVANPRGWTPPADDPPRDAAFADDCADCGMAVVVHAPYLVNFGSPSEETRTRSAAAVAHSIARGRRLGARAVVVHAGSAVTAGRRDEAIALLREQLMPLVDRLEDADPDVLLEPTAGGGQPLAAQVEQLGELVDALGRHPRIGVCFDTCHALAAGHDVTTSAGMTRTVDALVAAVGADRLRLVHVNDSRDPLGSGRDRHAPIGTGEIGVEPLRALLKHRAVRGVPVVMETPGDAQSHREQLATLRALRDG